MAAAEVSAIRTTRRTAAKAEKKEPLQVRIPVAVKRRFKAHASMRGIEPNALLVKLWEDYETRVLSTGEGDIMEKGAS
jgi:hypothetical protein